MAGEALLSAIAGAIVFQHFFRMSADVHLPSIALIGKTMSMGIMNLGMFDGQQRWSKQIIDETIA
jgi:hypothetical protein